MVMESRSQIYNRLNDVIRFNAEIGRIVEPLIVRTSKLNSSFQSRDASRRQSILLYESKYDFANITQL